MYILYFDLRNHFLNEIFMCIIPPCFSVKQPYLEVTMFSSINQIQLNMDWNRFSRICSGIGTSVITAISFCLKPDLFWLSGILSLPLAYKMRETSNKIKTIWEQNKFWTIASICLSSFLSLTAISFAVVFVYGSYYGSNLYIHSATKKSLSVYQSRFNIPIDEAQEEAMVDFLTTDRNLLTFNSLYKHLDRIAHCNEKAHATFSSHLSKESYDYIERERKIAFAKVVKLEMQIKNLKDPSLVIETIKHIVHDVLNIS